MNVEEVGEWLIEETIEVEATLKVRCKYPVWINNRITKEEEKSAF